MGEIWNSFMNGMIHAFVSFFCLKHVGGSYCYEKLCKNFLNGFRSVLTD